MDAIRNEFRTGLPTQGSWHDKKGRELVRGLRRWLKNNPNADPHDRLVAQSLLDDLLSALGGR